MTSPEPAPQPAPYAAPSGAPLPGPAPAPTPAQPGYGAPQPGYAAQPGYGAQPAQPGYGAQPGYTAQPGYGAQPAYAAQPPQPVAPSPAMAPPGAVPWATQRKRPIVLEIVLVVLGGLLASAFVVLMALVTSGTTVGVAVVLALVPLVTIGALIMWVDRWEPEPRFLLVGAFLWGGGVAVAVASLLNSVVGPALAGALGTGLDPGTASAVLGAPIVEEAMKGLGILLIFLVRRREFNGPLDGAVYGAVVALGFSVVEDVQYFALNAEDMGMIFVMRALLSPFGHLVYSVPMGIALGIASRRRSKAAWLWLFPLGYLAAVALHMGWNGSLSFASSFTDLVAIFVLLNWLPLALLAGIAIWLRQREQHVVGRRLRDYVPSGWLSEAEVQALSSMQACRAARRWAAGVGAKPAMRAYQRTAARLAYARQDLYTGHVARRARQDEAHLLEELARARAEVMARATPRHGY